MEHLKTRADRVNELEQLIAALNTLVAFLRREQMAEDFVEDYGAAATRARALLEQLSDQGADQPFDHHVVSELGATIPRMIYTHPHWVPPQEQSGGRWTTPPWFDELEPLHEAALGWAGALCIVGAGDRVPDRG